MLLRIPLTVAHNGNGTTSSGGVDMSRSKPLRSFLAFAVLTTVTAVSACNGDRRTPQADTSPGSVGVVDSAPGSVAATVAAMLSDENVFALLDTAYAAMTATDRLAQGKTEGAVNARRIRRGFDRDMSTPPLL